jgi:Right handed beta helix region
MLTQALMIQKRKMAKSRNSVRLTIALVAAAVLNAAWFPAITSVSAQVSAGNCALPNYPDASCTGVPAGTALTVVNGDMTISTANTVVDSKDIRGCVKVTAPGVIIRNSKITCSTGPYTVDTIGVAGTWLTIQDSTLSCANRVGTNAVGEEQVNVLRSDISGCENGFDTNKNMLIQDNYIHDLAQSSEAHTDGIQMWNTATNVTIQHNRIYANDGTSAIISPSQGTLGTVIRDNLFAGGAYTLYCRQAGSGGQHIINNHFSTIFYPKVGGYGPWTDCEDEAEVSGNVYHETGQLLPGQGTAPPPPKAPAAPTSVRIIQ